jgi:hypothetical protein
VQDAIELARDVRIRRNIVAHELKAFVPHQVRDVVGIAGYKVVEAYNVMTVSEKAIAQV